jgi:thioredoxin reductase (NADPH)
MTWKIHKVIIIWSWPAGHTAAIYAWRALLEPLMFEWFMAAWVAAWWQLTTTTDIENFPWFPEGIWWPELMHRMREQSLRSWCTILTSTVDWIDLASYPYRVGVWEHVYQTQALIIATWATAKRLHLPWEELFRQKWISACAVCDWWLPMFRGQHLVVIWGWDTACEEAQFLTKFAEKVTMVVRKDHLRASKVMQERVLSNPSITIRWNTEAVRVSWDNFMQAITLVNTLTWVEELVAARGLFYAIGHTPNSSFHSHQLALDEAWYIRLSPGTQSVLSPDGVTPIPWVFAAWDVADKKYRQAITSAGTWCIAAMDAEHRLQSHV